MKKLVILLIVSLAARAGGAADPVSVLARILAEKGIIEPSDREAVESASQSERMDVLISLFQNKGVLGAADLARLSESRTAAPISLSSYQQVSRPQDPPQATVAETSAASPR